MIGLAFGPAAVDGGTVETGGLPCSYQERVLPLVDPLAEFSRQTAEGGSVERASIGLSAGHLWRRGQPAATVSESWM